MRKIKVLYIITRLCKGGAQEVVLQIVRNLDKKRYDITLAFGPQDLEMEGADIPKVKTVIIPQLVRKIDLVKDIVALFKLYFFIRKENFDIVHTHTSKAGILGRAAAKLSGAPIIFHMPHGSIFHPIYFSRISLFILSRIEKIAAFYTDKIIVGSDNEKDDFISNEIGSEEKFVKIPYYFLIADKFYDVKVDYKTKRKELNIAAEVFLLVNIARLVPEKGHIFCLEAFKKVADVISNAMLLVVGDGPERKTIENKILELNLGKKVILTGFRKDIPEMLSISNVSLHTSLWEGTPIAITEAMFMGKAVIATRVGGVPEIIKDGVNGILVQSENADELAQSIIQLWRDKALLDRLGREAREYAKTKFCANYIINEINSLYESYLRTKIRSYVS